MIVKLYLIFLLLNLNLIFSSDVSKKVEYYDGYAVLSDISVDDIQKVIIVETTWGKLSASTPNAVNYTLLDNKRMNVSISNDMIFRGMIRLFANKKKAAQEFLWNPAIITSISRIPTEGGNVTVVGKYLQVINGGPNSLIFNDDVKYRDSKNESTENIFVYSNTDDIVENKDLDLVFKIRDSQFHFNYTFVEPSIKQAKIENSVLIIDGSSFTSNKSWIDIKLGDISLKPKLGINHVQITSKLDSIDVQSRISKYGNYPITINVNGLNSNPYNISIFPTLKSVNVKLNNSIDGGYIEMNGLFIYVQNTTKISVTFIQLNCTVNPTLANNGTMLIAEIPPFMAKNMDPKIFNNTSVAVNFDSYKTILETGNILVNSPNITGITVSNNEVIVSGINFGLKPTIQIFVDNITCNITYQSESLIKFVKPLGDGQKVLSINLNGFQLDFPQTETFVNVKTIDQPKENKHWIVLPLVFVSLLVIVISFLVWRFKYKDERYERVHSISEVEMTQKFSKFVIDDVSSSDDEKTAEGQHIIINLDEKDNKI